MRPDILQLFVLMGAITYALRAASLVVPLPRDRIAAARPYLRLVPPVVLSALAAITAFVAFEGDTPRLALGTDTIAIAVGLVVIAWRQNIALGIVIGVAAAIVLRALA